MIASDDGVILIDATRDFEAQARATTSIDLVLVTHAHRDASGGIGRLDRWLDVPTPLVTSRATAAALRDRHQLSHLAVRNIASKESFVWRGWRIIPLAVPHARDCTTFAWRLERDGISIVYASDVARLTPALARLADACDLLALDGAMWGRRIFTHLEIRSTVPIIARWPVQRVLFTQLGRSTPDHELLDLWLHATDSRLGAAYDGMVVELG